MDNERIKTCFISASIEADTRLIRNALIKRGVQLLGPDDLAPGASWRTAMIANITRADLVIGILTHRDSANTIFELGIAVGHGKPLLLFTPTKADLLPSNLEGHQVVRASLQNREAIDFALDQVLARPAGQMRSDVARTPSPLKRSVQASSYRSRLAQILRDHKSLELQSLVSEILKASGAEIVAEANSPDRGFDLAVWSDDLQDFVDNPFPIEVKIRLSSRENAKRALNQTAKSASAIGARWSMLLYGEGPSPDNRVWQSSPTVLALQIDDLLIRLESMSFPDIVRTMRNRRVHGLDD